MHLKLDKDFHFTIIEATDEEKDEIVQLAIHSILKHMVIFDAGNVEKIKELMTAGAYVEDSTEVEAPTKQKKPRRNKNTLQ